MHTFELIKHMARQNRSDMPKMLLLEVISRNIKKTLESQVEKNNIGRGMKKQANAFIKDKQKD